MAPASFASRLIAWHDRSGRHDLPWQREPTPYRVWVSEIMLQQTQVGVVRGYFERFTARFPDVVTLADAPVDDVLHLWSGLGYYARARNLHRAAELVRDAHRGAFPEDVESVAALPGIGRSTAGAILALSRGQRHPILDGNVKRVLARHRLIEGWPGTTTVARALWAAADALTPETRVDTYTQAIMDLGATVCVRRRPLCLACPVADDCGARAEGRQHDLPAPRPRKVQPERETVFLVLRDDAGRVLLERRPPAGIWGGLWSFPECGVADAPAPVVEERFGLAVAQVAPLGPLHHGFTHFRLTIRPVLVDVGVAPTTVVADHAPSRRWVDPASPSDIGVPAPVAGLLAMLARG